MNTGKLKDFIEVCKKVKEKDSKGQIKDSYVSLNEKGLRGNYRGMQGKEVLANNVELNSRYGDILTRYYPLASESLVIKLNRKDLYEVITFTHSDKKDSTLWTVKRLA